MIITNKTLPRRTFLRGVGATMALPVLDSMFSPLTRRGADDEEGPRPARLRLHAERHHRVQRQEPEEVPVDADDGRRQLRVQPDDEVARAVPRATSSCSAGWRRSPAGRSATARATTRARPRRGSPACIRTRPAAPISSSAFRPTRSRRRSSASTRSSPRSSSRSNSRPLAGNCDSGYTCAYMSMSWRVRDQPAAGRNQSAHGVRAAVRRRREHRADGAHGAAREPEERARLRHRQPDAPSGQPRRRRQAEARRISRGGPRHRAAHSARRRAERHDEAAAHGAAERDSGRLRAVLQADDGSCRSSPGRPT